MTLFCLISGSWLKLWGKLMYSHVLSDWTHRVCVSTVTLVCLVVGGCCHGNRLFPPVVVPHPSQFTTLFWQIEWHIYYLWFWVCNIPWFQLPYLAGRIRTLWIRKYRIWNAEPPKWFAVASFPDLLRFYFLLAFIIIHRTGRPVKNGEGLGAFVMWMMLAGCEGGWGGGR